MTQIQSDIPPPPNHRPRGGKIRRYPWHDMKVGDSFAAHGVSRNAIRTTATYHEQRKGWQFVVDYEGDHLRVWRVA